MSSVLGPANPVSSSEQPALRAAAGLCPGNVVTGKKGLEGKTEMPKLAFAGGEGLQVMKIIFF